MHQILFKIGPFTARSYGLMMSLGMVGAIALVWHLARKRGKYADAVLDMAFYLLLAGLVGARIWEVVFDWGYYSGHLIEIPAIWLGGLSVQGSIIGGMLAVILYTRKHGIPFWEFVDLAAPGVLLGQAIGRVGCYLNGCCYGVPAVSSWGVVYPPGTDAYAAFGSTPLIPAVLYESAWDLAAMALLLFLLSRKHFNGFIATLYFIIYAVGRTILEFYRADSLMIWGMKAAQLTSVLTILVALAVMFSLWKKSKSSDKNSKIVNVKK